MKGNVRVRATEQKAEKAEQRKANAVSGTAFKTTGGKKGSSQTNRKKEQKRRGRYYRNLDLVRVLTSVWSRGYKAPGGACTMRGAQ